MIIESRLCQINIVKTLSLTQIGFTELENLGFKHLKLLKLLFLFGFLVHFLQACLCFFVYLYNSLSRRSG